MNNQWDNAVRQYVRSRPILVTVFGLVYIAMGLWAICSGVGGAVVATFQLLTCTLAFGTPIKALIMGVLQVMVGSALLNGSGWARTLTIVISVINLLVILLPGTNANGEFWNAVLSVLMIVYMMTPGVKAWFAGR